MTAALPQSSPPPYSPFEVWHSLNRLETHAREHGFMGLPEMYGVSKHRVLAEAHAVDPAKFLIEYRVFAKKKFGI